MCDQVLFKKTKQKNFRRRISSDDDQELTSDNNLGEIKKNQKLRERSRGVSLIGLALGKKIAADEDISIDNQFPNSKAGGLVNMHALKSSKLKEPDDAYDVGIGTQFSAETNKRDEDEEMMKYIEQELQKRKGVGVKISGHNSEEALKYVTPEEAALFAVPEHLRKSTTQRSEEMLSNQMLNGIPEVDLGIDAKIKNIEATEEAKQKLLQEQRKIKDVPSQFVPTNMAVNFMQHNRFNFGDNQEMSKRYSRPQADTEQIPQNQSNAFKRATDDQVYDKFKKQFRRF